MIPPLALMTEVFEAQIAGRHAGVGLEVLMGIESNEKRDFFVADEVNDDSGMRLVFTGFQMPCKIAATVESVPLRVDALEHGFLAVEEN